MSYNPRMSMVPSSQQRQKQTKKKEDESDAFMRLSDHEIAGCISDIGVPLTSAELQKPEPKQIQLIFEWFAELLMNTTRETVEPAMRAASEDICGDFGDIIPAETRNLMGFYISLRRLLLECGINDFSFQDLIKPTHDRLVKIFSYIINFVRFRESHTGVIDEHFNKAEGIKERIETLYLENQEMEARLEEMREQRKAMEVHVSEKTKRNNELKQQLLTLHSNQEKAATRFQNVQKKKADLTALLREKTATTITLKQESAKLRPYVQQSPEALHASLSELSNTLNDEKSQIEALDRRARAIQTSTDTFNTVTVDVSSCVKVLEDIDVELGKEEEEMAKVQRQKDALSERGNNVREVQRTEAMLQRQLAKIVDKTEKLRESSKEKANAAKSRQEELRQVHVKLAEERAEKGREMERRRVRIEQTEKKMADLKENIENEIQEAQSEYLKLESHVKLYITEMEQAI